LIPLYNRKCPLHNKKLIGGSASYDIEYDEINICLMRIQNKEDTGMTVGAVNGSQGVQQPGKIGGRQDDPVAKGIQDKINRAQKELQELNGRRDMPPEKKQEKRQELQKEINELNMQLRQHEMEQKVKEREEKRQAEENPLGLPENQDMARKDSRPGVELGISAAGMEALISADGARKAADTQGSVAQRMEGKAGVLEVEIKMDAARNGDTSSKQEQLADVTNKAQAAQSAQMSSLQKAGEELEKAADAGEGMEGVQKKDEDKVSSKDDAANDNGEESRNGKESG